MPPSTAHINLRLRGFIFFSLMAVYLLVYIPTPDSADGDAILAVSASLVRSGSADIAALGAQDALFEYDMSRMGALGCDGVYYAKKGITPSLFLLPFAALAQQVPWLSLRAVAMLFNPLVTAFTAVLLYDLVRLLGFLPRSGLIAALVYGLGTTAFVYVKTLFGEPLAALLLTLAVLSALRYWQGGSLRWLILSGGAMGAAIGVNLSYLLPAALLGLIVISQARTSHTLARISLTYGLPIALCIGGIALYNAARFCNPLTSGYYLDSGEGFNRPFLTGLFGLTFSPYRGLFWYAPIFLVSAFGLPRLPSRKAVLTVALLVAAQFFAYANWWSWHGGVVWGPRFLLPIMPLLVLCLVPLIERAYEAWPMRAALNGLAALSILIQICGALLSPYPFYGELLSKYGSGDMNAVVAVLDDAVLTDPDSNAVFGHLRLLTEQFPLDPLWLRGGINLIILGGAQIVAVLALWIVRAERTRLAIGITGLIAACVMLGVAAQGAQSEDTQLSGRLAATLETPAPILLATNYLGSAVLDIKTHRVLSMAAPTAPNDPIAVRLWEAARTLDDKLWYVTWFGRADPLNWVERALWQESAFVAERNLDGHRALLFRFRPPQPDTDGGWRFGQIRLTRYAVKTVTDGLFVSLEWRAEGGIGADYGWFVHALDANGQIIAQQDRVPQGGYLPTSGWQAGEAVRDYLFFPTQAAAIRIGWVDPINGSRLPAFTAEDTAITEDFVVIGVTR
ncbi:MAG: hypothetical protein OHK0023_03270 [Anaerolineae bacterium]